MTNEKTYDLTALPLEDLFKQVGQDFPGVPYHVRDHLGFLPQYVEWIQRGTKRCTIRFRRDELDLPSGVVLPIRETKPDDPTWRHDVGEVFIERLALKRFGFLNAEDSVWDGFKEMGELQKALQRVYGTIEPHQFVSIYWFRIKSWGAR